MLHGGMRCACQAPSLHVLCTFPTPSLHLFCTPHAQDCFGGCTDPSQGFNGMLDEVRCMIWEPWKVVCVWGGGGLAVSHAAGECPYALQQQLRSNLPAIQRRPCSREPHCDFCPRQAEHPTF